MNKQQMCSSWRDSNRIKKFFVFLLSLPYFFCNKAHDVHWKGRNFVSHLNMVAVKQCEIKTHHTQWVCLCIIVLLGLDRPKEINQVQWYFIIRSNNLV